MVPLPELLAARRCQGRVGPRLAPRRARQESVARGAFLPHRHGARVRFLGPPRSASGGSERSARARRYALRGPTRPTRAEKSVPVFARSRLPPRLKSARSGDVLSTWPLPASTCKNVPVLQVRQATRLWAGGSPPGRGAARACAALGTAPRPNTGCPRIGPQCRVSAEGSRTATTDSDRARGGAEQGVPPAIATGRCQQLRFRVRLRRRARIDTGLARTRLGSSS